MSTKNKVWVAVFIIAGIILVAALVMPAKKSQQQPEAQNDILATQEVEVEAAQ